MEERGEEAAGFDSQGHQAMITICIPVYNQDVSILARELHRQCIASAVPFELLVMEDGSTLHVETNERALKALDGARHLIHQTNLGRSAARNWLIDQACYDHVVMMDCDARVENASYIRTWLDHCSNEVNVIIGGTAYDSTVRDPNYSLRLHYGRVRESAMHKHKAFTAFNFMLHKSVSQKVRFNEMIKGYGQEDFLYGEELMSAEIPILFIENRLIHDGLDPNALFLTKTEEGVKNLLMLDCTGRFPFMRERSKLLRSYTLLRKFRLNYVVGKIYSIFRTLLRRQLSSPKPSLFLFDLYKLGHICYISKYI